MDTQTFIGTLVVVSCGAEGCGQVFGMERHFYDARQSDGKTWYCPSGHPRCYGDTTEARLRRSLQSAQAESERLRQRAQTYDRARAAALGQVTRIKNRIERGICHRCNRSFCNLRRHMESKHGAPR